MRGNNIGGPELKSHRSEVVLEEAADGHLPKVLRTVKTFETDGTNTLSRLRAYSDCVERARRVVADLGEVGSNRTDRPLSPGPGSGEIRVENRRVLVVRNPVFGRNFPVSISRKVPGGAPEGRLPRQNPFRLDGKER